MMNKIQTGSNAAFLTWVFLFAGLTGTGPARADTCASTPCLNGGTCTDACADGPGDVFISEYIEGSGEHKVIELYNASADDVDLSLYYLLKGTNGAAFPTTESGSNVLQLSGTVASGATFVICRDNSNNVLPIKSKADGGVCDLATTNSVMQYNGDDAMGLRMGGAVIVDVVGVEGVDPGSFWGVTCDPNDLSSCTDSTKDHTIVRNSNINMGTYGSWDQSEWTAYDQDTFTDLGSHTIGCASPSYTCTCADGFTGGDCETAVDCPANSVADVNNPGSCLCDGEYTGTVTWNGTDYDSACVRCDECGVCDGDPTNDCVFCDDCGECDSDASNNNTTCTQDCAGTWGGDATTDDCGVCDSDSVNDNTTCTQDCNGIWNGDSYADDCGVCDNDNTNDNTTCAQDCAGVWGGDASFDDCAVCDNDPSNNNTTCTQDCNNVWGGDAVEDDCGVCDNDSSNNNSTCTQDCNDVWGGDAIEDDCGVCDNDPANNNATCTQDCAGVWGGEATTDDCGVCDVDTGNNNTTCTLDCAGVWGGNAILDDCGVCDDDSSNNNTTCTQDCNGFWNGPATEDACGVCDDIAENDNITCTLDCNLDIDGTAYTDYCGNCVGGNTGAEPCGWSDDCVSSSTGSSFYGDGECDCGCGIDDIDCGDNTNVDADSNPITEDDYGIDECVYANYCPTAHTVNPDNPSECLPPPPCDGAAVHVYLWDLGYYADGVFGSGAITDGNGAALEPAFGNVEGRGGFAGRFCLQPDASYTFSYVFSDIEEYPEELFYMLAPVTEGYYISSDAPAFSGGNPSAASYEVTFSATQSCYDLVLNQGETTEAPWQDSEGRGCGFYEENPEFCLFASDYINDGVAANNACCVCGGNIPPPPTDCNGDPDGLATVDNCGICAGGNTGQEPCGWRTACTNTVFGSFYGDGECDCGCGIDDVDCGNNSNLISEDDYTVQECDYANYCPDGEVVNPNNPAECGVFDCNGDQNGTATRDKCGQCTGGNTGLEPCGWSDECSFEYFGTIYYGYGDGYCDCGCGIHDVDCLPSDAATDADGPGYSVAACEYSYCGELEIDPVDPSGCLDPSLETDAGSSDGSGDGATIADAGTADGSADGTGNGSDTSDAGTADGSTDGTGDGSDTSDAGTADGSTDGTGDGSEDAGSLPDLCDEADCEDGYECLIDVNECNNTESDAGTDSDAGMCMAYEVAVCVAVSDGGVGSETEMDAGNETAAPVVDAGADLPPDPVPTTDAGSAPEPQASVDAGTDGDPVNPNPIDVPDDEALPAGCTCRSETTSNSTGTASLLGLGLFGIFWRRRRR